MSAAAEFPRPVPLDRLGDRPREERIEATADECAALARRFGLLAIDRLAADAVLVRTGDTVTATGRLEAAVVQACVATGDPLQAEVREDFTLRFVPLAQADAEEVELSEAELDVLPYEGAAIDLGEAVAQTLSLALDPFPRSPDADARLREAGVADEGDAGPFAALKALKDRLD